LSGTLPFWTFLLNSKPSQDFVFASDFRSNFEAFFSGSQKASSFHFEAHVSPRLADKSNMGFQLLNFHVWLVILALAIQAAIQAPSQSLAADRSDELRTMKALVYQGKVLDPRGKNLKGKFELKIEIYSPEPNLCLLWSERQPLDFGDGGFAVEIGYDRYRSQGAAGGVAATFADVFVNNSSFSLPNAECAVGTTYTASETGDRLLFATFSQGTTEIIVSGLPIKAVPFALQAGEIGGFGLPNLLKMSGAGSSLTFTPNEVQTLKDLLGGDVFFDFKARSLRNLADPAAPQDAATKAWVESNLSSTLVSAGLGTVSNVSVTGGALAVTNGSTTPRIALPQASSSASGYLSNADWTSFNSRLTRVGLADIKNILGFSQFPGACTSSQTLTWTAVTDVLACSDINGLNANKITAGILAANRLGSGTADATTYLRGDGSWATIPPGADQLGNHTATQNINLANFRLVGGGGSTGISVDSTGSVGVGITSPTVKFDVNGEIKIGNSSTVCSLSIEGALRYNSTTKRMEFCNGTAWSQISAGTVASVTIGNPSLPVVSTSALTFLVTYGSGADTATINLNSGSIAFSGTNFSDCAVTGIANTSVSTRTVTVSGCSGTGTVAISIASGTASSTTGDPSPAAGPSATFLADNTGPSAPGSPGLGGTPTSLSSSPVFSYSASSDTGGSSVASYQVQILRVSDSAQILDWTTHTSGTAVTGLSLAPSTQYSIRARAMDALGNVGAISSAQTWTSVNGYVFAPTLTADATNYNIRASAITAGWDQVLPLIVNMTINAGVKVYSTSPSTPAIQTGTMTVGSSVTINNNGSILGGAVGSGAGDKTTNQAWEGGTALVVSAPTTINNTGLIIGGAGGGGQSEGDACCGGGNGGSAGGQGGPAIVFNAAATITNSGSIFGAGGGGAGGAGGWAAGVGAGWGGNGQGAYNGSVDAAVAGRTTGICGGGFGGNGGTYGQPGGNGGSCGSAAASGGAGGYAMVLNGSAVTLNSSSVVSNTSYTEGSWISGTKGRIAP